MRRPSNGASPLPLWALRALWIAVGVLAPWSTAVEERSTAVRAVAMTWGWSLWAVVLFSLLVPAAVSLTVVRAAMPIAFAASIADGRAGVIALVLLAWAVSSLPDTADALVQGGAYGAETRFLLRTPLTYVLPTLLAMGVQGATVFGGTLLLASRQWVAGGILAVLGLVLLRTVPRQLHRLSSRWLVLVPAGMVLHDHMVLAETMMLRMSNVTGISMTATNGEAADLTGGVLGPRISVSAREADKVILSPITAKVLGTGEALHVQAFTVAPRRTAVALRMLGETRS